MNDTRTQIRAQVEAARAAISNALDQAGGPNDYAVRCALEAALYQVRAVNAALEE